MHFYKRFCQSEPDCSCDAFSREAMRFRIYFVIFELYVKVYVKVEKIRPPWKKNILKRFKISDLKFENKLTTAMSMSCRNFKVASFNLFQKQVNKQCCRRTGPSLISCICAKTNIDFHAMILHKLIFNHICERCLSDE